MKLKVISSIFAVLACCSCGNKTKNVEVVESTPEPPHYNLPSSDLCYFEAEGPVKAIRYLNGPFAHLGIMYFEDGNLIGVQNPFGNITIEKSGSKEPVMIVDGTRWDSVGEYLTIKVQNDLISGVTYRRNGGPILGSDYNHDVGYMSYHHVSRRKPESDPGKYVRTMCFIDSTEYYSGMMPPEQYLYADSQHTLRFFLMRCEPGREDNEIDHRGNWLCRRIVLPGDHKDLKHYIYRTIAYNRTEGIEDVNEVLRNANNPAPAPTVAEVKDLISNVDDASHWISESIPELQNNLKEYLLNSGEFDSDSLEIVHVYWNAGHQDPVVEYKVNHGNDNFYGGVIFLSRKDNGWKIVDIGVGPFDEDGNLFNYSEINWAIGYLSQFNGDYSLYRGDY